MVVLVVLVVLGAEFVIGVSVSRKLHSRQSDLSRPLATLPRILPTRQWLRKQPSSK